MIKVGYKQPKGRNGLLTGIQGEKDELRGAVYLNVNSPSATKVNSKSRNLRAVRLVVSLEGRSRFKNAGFRRNTANR